MAQSERKMIGFSADEANQIHGLLVTAKRPPELEGVTTFSETVRRLIRIGLRQVAYERLAAGYEATAAVAGSLHPATRVERHAQVAVRAVREAENAVREEEVHA